MLASLLTVICTAVLAASASPALPRASPHTIKLSSRKLTSGGPVRRALAPFEVPLTDYFNGTDLQYVASASVNALC